jgi:hypothetical protein
MAISTGSFSRSGKTYYTGSNDCHGITPCALISRNCDDGITAAQDVEKSESIIVIGDCLNPMVLALNELLPIGVDLVKSGLIQLDVLILLTDCASPKIPDKHKESFGKSCNLKHAVKFGNFKRRMEYP